MAKLVNWNKFDRRLREKRIFLFSAEDICRLFGSTKVAALFLLHRYARQGWILRLKRNLYSLPGLIPPAPLIANKMVDPSYVSLEFALSYYGIIPETVYTVTSVTTKSTRTFEALGKCFSYRHIKKEVFTGYRVMRENNDSFLIAEPEKAFVDYCYFKIRNRGETGFRFDGKKLNWRKVLSYSELFHNQKLVAFLKEKNHDDR